ncbi:MAG: hypothetical protein Q9168_007864, partial [Polycauliona sp. 1 TL-2023]
AIFATNVFSLESLTLIGVITPEYIELWLRDKIARPAAHEQDGISSAIVGISKLLLANSPAAGYEKRRLQYVGRLCHAVAQNFAYQIEGLIDTMSQIEIGAPFTASDLLSAAAAVGDSRTVYHLLQADVQSCCKSTVFGRGSANAARNGDTEMLRLIFETSANPKNGLDAQITASTALLAASEAGQQGIVDYLMPSMLQTYLSDFDLGHGFEAAAANGHTNILNLVLPYLSTTNRKDILSRSLCRASSCGHSNAVQYLLNSGSSPDSWSPTGGALHAAAHCGWTQIVRILLDAGADPNLRAMGNGQPLFFAARKGHTEVVQLLLDHGADINARSSAHTGLVRAARNGELAMVKFLLDKGVKLTAYGNGNRALQHAAGMGHEDIVRFLIERGVDVNGYGSRKDPPILRAMNNGQQHVVRLMLDLGAREQGSTGTE